MSSRTPDGDRAAPVKKRDHALRYIDLRTIRQRGYVTVLPILHYGPVPVLVDGRDVERMAARS